jgi:hypothetical protein
LVPKTISMVVNNLKKEKGGDRYVGVKDSTVNFEYSRFRKANVEVKILDEDTN